MINLQLDDFIQYKFLSKVKVAPDGKNACFVISQANVEDNNYHSNLWLYNLENHKEFQLTTCNKEGNFLWMQDGEHILFPGVRNPKDKEKREAGEEFTQYYKINIHGGEAQEAFRIPHHVEQIKQVDDNTFLFTATYNSSKKDLNSLSKEEKEEELKLRKENKDYEVLDEIPFWGNGAGFTNKSRSRLYMFQLDTKSVEAITDEHTDVYGFELNKAHSKAVFVASAFKDKLEMDNEILLYDIATKQLERVSPEEQFSYQSVHFITEDQLICTGKDRKAFGANENAKFYVMDLQGQTRKCITPDFDYAIYNSVGSDCRYGNGGGMLVDGEYLYFVTTEGDSSYLNQIDIQGQIEKIVTEKGSVDDYSVKDGKVVFIGLRGVKLQELYSVQEGKENQITSCNEWIQKEKKLSSYEALSVETAPGVMVDGWVLKPVDFDENKKYPAILDIHGGPKTVYGEVFYHEMQYWANEGYVVFFCNPRGSDGKGNEFADIRGKYGTIDYEDLMKFTDAVLEKYPFIDKERVGVTGGSYGGFMTNWIIGHTDRFRAAASQRSISNWISKFCTTDIGYYFVDDQIGATPWGNHEKLWEHSPLKYADRVKTPTLFIHSEEDYRCWLVEGIQMFTALKYHGVESRLCMFRGENHELSRSGKPKHRIRRLKEITDWFNQYLK